MRKLVYFSTDHPWAVMTLTIVLTILFGLPLANIKIDTDPENMLEDDQPDRVYYRQVKRDFGIYDFIVLGIVDDEGAFRPETLAPMARLVASILQIKGVVTADVLSLTTTDDVTTSSGTLQIHRIMETVPASPSELELLREAVLSNPLFANKLASADGRALAIYIPIERKDESYRIAREVEALARHGAPSDSAWQAAGRARTSHLFLGQTDRRRRRGRIDRRRLGSEPDRGQR